MLLTIKAKLLPSPEQSAALLITMERFNLACNKVSDFAFESSCFNHFKLHKALYKGIRDDFLLPAQLTIRCISKVAESYKRIKKKFKEAESTSDEASMQKFNKISFRPHSCLVYDQRNMSWKGPDTVSLTTMDGRIIVPVVFGERYSGLDRKSFTGQADLIYTGEEFYLCFVRGVQEKRPLVPDGVVGVDLGIVNLATTSDGKIYTGDDCEKVRKRYAALRRKLQKVGTRSAKKHLKRLGRAEKKFKKNENHRISKALVSLAEGTKRAIALEDLSGIRSRTTVKKDQRDRYSKWAFWQLRFFIEYKAKLAGVPVLNVDPKNTSRMCSCCGFVDKRNRKSRGVFVCLSCGYAENADVNSAKNIRGAAIVQPIVVRHAECSV